ncbi:multiple sugar transport system permease protein [Paenibacillus sp. yr247]|uniref:carbohydrate ABC transporter permease n=1 Tax=Paenibacillus sp. yr247 TaxID=1761880 RepID=UPI000883DF34|nr:sugar ABC transporter permease [Paenibacillus sp. yr247]SDM79835.1 multiple sugar transport system permease protein [Paenibacillus sp. yr247]
MKWNKLTPYFLISPAYSLFIVFFILPVILSFQLSFFEWNGFSANKVFIGIDNYKRILSDLTFWNAMKNTMVYTFSTVPLSLALGLLFALLLSGGIKGTSVFRAIYFMPMIISMVAIAVVWNWIYSPNEYGLANAVLHVCGIPMQTWLSDPKLALVSIIVMGVWKNMGYCMVIMLAGLKSISPSLYEASSMDGADKWQQFRTITVPMLMPTTTFLLIVQTVHSFQVFDQINVMTKGGPVGSTEVIVSYLYKLGFDQFEMGYASAVAYVLFVIIVGITLVQRKLLDRNTV